MALQRTFFASPSFDEPLQILIQIFCLCCFHPYTEMKQSLGACFSRQQVASSFFVENILRFARFGISVVKSARLTLRLDLENVFHSGPSLHFQTSVKV